MKNIRGKIAHLLKFPPHIIVRKVWNRLIEIQRRKKHERIFTTTDSRNQPGHQIRIGRFKLPWLIKDEQNLQTLSWLTDRYMEHRFDILGSGWIVNSYSAGVPGIEEFKYDPKPGVGEIDDEGDWLVHVVLPAHLSFSKNVWKEIKSFHPDYQPIDWQRDVKSGYRWNAKDWFRKQRAGSDNSPGADIKMPWELSRLQHLNRMLYVAAHSNRSKEIIREVLAQILDFIASNPIGMGANFNCPMDIGIRNANILVAFDLARQLDVYETIKPIHRKWINRYVKESTEHILEDIEYREGKTSNHYLGNVLGVLFAGAYLHESNRTSQYLSFGLQELKRSFDRQFFEDGSNFEGSTAYHRLSGEMILYGVALAARIHDDELESLKSIDLKTWKCKSPLFKSETGWIRNHEAIASKLLRSAEFSQFLTKPDGTIVQFGDNDSGRFMSFSAEGEMLKTDEAFRRYENWQDRDLHPTSEMIFDENLISHAAFISGVNGLLFQSRDTLEKNYVPVEYHLLQHLGKFIFQNFKPQNGPDTNEIGTFSNFEEWTYKAEWVHKLPEDLQLDYRLKLYPDFQMAVACGADFYCALSGISNPNQHHSLSHVHNDKGAVELSVKGKHILLDPGTYLYTPIPKRRIEYRSVQVHNTIVVNDQEQNEPLPGAMGLFNMHPRVKVQGMSTKNDQLQIELHYNGIKHVRSVSISTERLVVRDYCTHEFEQRMDQYEWFSNGYGKRMKRP